MTPDGAGLVLTQWLSPAFPVGGFAWSHGLEQVIAEGSVHDSESLSTWLDTVLTEGAGRNDIILLSAAWHAGSAEDVAEIADLARALAPSAERRRETMEQGAALARTLRDVWNLDLPDMALPVTLGRAARLAGEPLVPAAALYLQAMLTNLVQAAQRLMPLGQTAAQRLLRDLSAGLADHAARITALDLDALGSSAFALDTAAMRHETLEPRIFRS